MDFEKTSLEFYGVLIQEPVTALTDLFVSGICLYAFIKLKPINQSASLLKYYFLSMAFATAYGGIIGHAFLDYVGFGWKVPGWLISMFSVALLERVSITHAQPILSKKIGTLFTTLNSIELAILFVIVLTTFNFTFVEAHAAYGLLIVVFSFEAYVFKLTKAEGSRLFLIATGISATAALVHLSQFSIHPWFNHLDLSHVLMAIAAYVFFRGGLKFECNNSNSTSAICFRNSNLVVTHNTIRSKNKMIGLEMIHLTRADRVDTPNFNSSQIKKSANFQRL